MDGNVDQHQRGAGLQRRCLDQHCAKRSQFRVLDDQDDAELVVISVRCDLKMDPGGGTRLLVVRPNLCSIAVDQKVGPPIGEPLYVGYNCAPHMSLKLNRQLMNAAEVSATMDRMADEILKANDGRPVVLIGIQRRGVPMARADSRNKRVCGLRGCG
jgi:hypothetical protein